MVTRVAVASCDSRPDECDALPFAAVGDGAAVADEVAPDSGAGPGAGVGEGEGEGPCSASSVVPLLFPGAPSAAVAAAASSVVAAGVASASVPGEEPPEAGGDGEAVPSPGVLPPPASFLGLYTGSSSSANSMISPRTQSCAGGTALNDAPTHTHTHTHPFTHTSTHTLSRSSDAQHTQPHAPMLHRHLVHNTGAVGKLEEVLQHAVVAALHPRTHGAGTPIHNARSRWHLCKGIIPTCCCCCCRAAIGAWQMASAAHHSSCFAQWQHLALLGDGCHAAAAGATAAATAATASRQRARRRCVTSCHRRTRTCPTTRTSRYPCCCPCLCPCRRQAGRANRSQATIAVVGAW